MVVVVAVDTKTETSSNTKKCDQGPTGAGSVDTKIAEDNSMTEKKSRRSSRLLNQDTMLPVQIPEAGVVSTVAAAASEAEQWLLEKDSTVVPTTKDKNSQDNTTVMSPAVAAEDTAMRLVVVAEATAVSSVAAEAMAVSSAVDVDMATIPAEAAEATVVSSVEAEAMAVSSVAEEDLATS